MNNNRQTLHISHVSPGKIRAGQTPGRKAMTIGIFLAALDQLSGNFALLSYTANIFASAGSVLSPNESALIVGAIQFIATCLVPLFVERAGRKVN